MKALWSVLVEKLREVEAVYAALVVGIFSLFALWMSTIVLCRFFNMIVEIVHAFAGQPIS